HHTTRAAGTLHPAPANHHFPARPLAAQAPPEALLTLTVAFDCGF
ncbi:hypothetical protein ABH926_003895, partial [Catenulispora sp. GP43]